MSEILSCDICNETFCNPITLICQHTFCRQCISNNIKECPLCRVKIPAIPVQTNEILEELVKLYFGDEKYKQIEDKSKRYTMEKDLTPVVMKEISKEIDESIKDNSKPSPKKNKEKIKEVQITTESPGESQEINEDEDETDFSISGTIRHLSKWMEYLFLCYYIFNGLKFFIPSIGVGLNWKTICILGLGGMYLCFLWWILTPQLTSQSSSNLSLFQPNSSIRTTTIRTTTGNLEDMIDDLMQNIGPHIA